MQNNRSAYNDQTSFFTNENNQRVSNNFKQSSAARNSNSNANVQNSIHFNNYQQRMRALGRVKYINQLAQLQYEQKLTELHTKYTSKTKQSVIKKLRSKNQMAQFIDEDEQELEEQFEQLMDYKYGSSKWKNFHFEKETSSKQYRFCPLCDEIHQGNESEHEQVCNYVKLVRSPNYYIESLARIKESLKRLTSQESQEINKIIDKIKYRQQTSEQLAQISSYVKNDQVLGRIVGKLKQIIEETQ